MNPSPNDDLDVKTLLALRQRKDAVQAILEHLRARDMGPADHIRTKHEVKLFVDAGNAKSAEDLLKSIRERLAAKRVATEQITHQQRLEI